MGDNDNANDIHKSFFENKLSNRSLVLVGGGVHSHASREEGGGTSTTTTTTTSVVQSAAAAAAVGKKRERKRIGGNGMFGSLSGRKRKKILMQQSCCNKIDKGLMFKDSSGPKSIGEVLQQGIERATASNTDNQSEMNKVNSILETLYIIWTEYIAQLLLHVKPELSKSLNKTDGSKSNHSSLDLIRVRSEISTLLLEAEHVGMPATIIECPSRRHLPHRRCMIVNETVNTYSVVVHSKRKCKKKTKSLSSDLPKDEPVDGDGSQKIEHGDESQDNSSHIWKVIMVPKRGTVLEVNISVQAEEHINVTNVSVRIET